MCACLCMHSACVPSLFDVAIPCQGCRLYECEKIAVRICQEPRLKPSQAAPPVHDFFDPALQAVPATCSALWEHVQQLCGASPPLHVAPFCSQRMQHAAATKPRAVPGLYLVHRVTASAATNCVARNGCAAVMKVRVKLRSTKHRTGRKMEQEIRAYSGQHNAGLGPAEPKPASWAHYAGRTCTLPAGM